MKSPILPNVMIYQRYSKKKGLSLLELLVTVVIFLPALLALLLAFYNRLALEELNKQRVIAVNDAQSCLEEIKALSYESIVSSYDCACENEAVTVTEPESNLKMVTVEVNWTWRQKNESFSLSTFIAK